MPHNAAEKWLTSWVHSYVMFSCVFNTYQYGVLGQVWYLIISIPDICLLPYFILDQLSPFSYIDQVAKKSVLR